MLPKVAKSIHGDKYPNILTDMLKVLSMFGVIFEYQ